MKEKTFMEYYNSISYDTELKAYKNHFDQYELSDEEMEVLLQDLDHFQRIRIVNHVLKQQRLKITKPEFLDKLVERITDPGVGMDCFFNAEKYFGIEKTLLVLIDYLEKEKYPEILNRFFEILSKTGIHYEAYKACYMLNHSAEKIRSILSYDTAKRLIEVFFNRFLKEEEMDFFYGYNLSRMISIQRECLPEDIHLLIPKVQSRHEELSKKTKLVFLILRAA